jgi:hypothetical protein
MAKYGLNQLHECQCQFFKEFGPTRGMSTLNVRVVRGKMGAVICGNLGFPPMGMDISYTSVGRLTGIQ